METEEIITQQRRSWNQFAPGWDKWDEQLMDGMQVFSDQLIAELNLKGDEHILDVASGTGEPGSSICTHLPKGKVTAIDLSANMVAIANENTKKRGISNFQSQLANASYLPFEDNSFDHIVSRFGIMFFPDMKKGIGEMKRVLKPGGTLAIASWAAPNLNPHISLMAAVVMEKLALPKPPPEAPGIFRCAKPGMVKKMFTDAGLMNANDTNVKTKISFGSTEQYWQVMTDVAGPIMLALNQAPSALKNEIKEAVLKKVGAFEKDKEILLPGEAIVTSGKKMEVNPDV